MTLQFAEMQQKNNMELVKGITSGLGKKLGTGFASVVGSVTKMTKAAAGNVEDRLEARKAEKVKTDRQIKWEARQEKFFGFMKSKWSSVAENKKVKATGSFLKKMFLGLLTGFALFSLPSDFWTGLKNMIFDFGKWIKSISWEKDIKPMLKSIKDAVVAAKDFIGKIIDKIFGAKDEKTGERKGGLLGKGGITTSVMKFFGFSEEEGNETSKTISKFVAALGVATGALAIMFPGKAIKLVGQAVWGLTKLGAKGAGALGRQGLHMLGGGRDGQAERFMTDKQRQMSQSRFANAQKPGPRVGKTPKGGGWFSKLAKKFGKAGKFIVNMGMKAVTGLMAMGPVGWGIVAAIAAAGLIWYFWEDVTKIWDVVVEKVTAGFTKIKEMVGGLAGSAQSFVGSWMRKMGAGMIADWIDPDGADPEKPKQEFTWKNFGLELWNLYTGLWKEVMGVVQKGFKAVRGIAATFAEKMGMPDALVNWIRGKEETPPPPPSAEDVGAQTPEAAAAREKKHKKLIKEETAKKTTGGATTAVAKGDVKGIESEIEALNNEWSTLGTSQVDKQRAAEIGKKVAALRSKKMAILDNRKATPVKSTKVNPKNIGIDWDFISKKEGGSMLNGYVPDPDGSKSGVTIATGFDLGARSIKDLQGLPQDLQAKLAPYLGLHGQDAVAMLRKQPLKISAKEAKLIDKMSKGAAVNKLQREWNKRAEETGGKRFEDLTSAQQTIAASVAFQYGSLSKTPNFRKAMQSGDWSKAVNELNNFGDSYSTRRQSEAKYLMASLDPNKRTQAMRALEAERAAGRVGTVTPTGNNIQQTTYQNNSSSGYIQTASAKSNIDTHTS